MRDKPPSQLIKAGGGNGNAVLLGPLGARPAVCRDWGLSLCIRGFAPIYPLPFRPWGTGKTWKAEAPLNKHLLCEQMGQGWGERHRAGILLWLRELDTAAPFCCYLVKTENRFDY